MNHTDANGNPPDELFPKKSRGFGEDDGHNSFAVSTSIMHGTLSSLVHRDLLIFVQLTRMELAAGNLTSTSVR